MKTTTFKRKRKEGFYSKLKKEMKEAQKARDARDGVYQSGIGMDDGYTEEDLADAAAGATGGGRQQSTATSDKVCTSCGQVGHSRRTSKKCANYQARNFKRKATTAAASTNKEQQDDNAAADELDVIDAMPIEDGSDSDDDEFYDALDAYGSDSSDSDPILRSII